MAYRKCGKCEQIRSKDLFVDGFTCTLCVPSPGGGGSPALRGTPSPTGSNSPHKGPPKALSPTSPYGTASPYMSHGSPYHPTGGTYTAGAASPSYVPPTDSPYGSGSPYKSVQPLSPRSPYMSQEPPFLGGKLSPTSPRNTAGVSPRPPAAKAPPAPAPAPPAGPSPPFNWGPSPFQFQRRPSTAVPKKDSPKWNLPKATLQNELRTAFSEIEINFEAVAEGKSIAFHELFTQQRAGGLIKSTFGEPVLCDACVRSQGVMQGPIQLFSRVHLCEACSTNGDIILRRRNDAARHLLTQAQRCFDLSDVDKSSGLDYLEYVHWTLELSTVTPCVPQKAILFFIREAFLNFAETPYGAPEISWQGVKSFFETCFKAVPPQLETTFNEQSKNNKFVAIWQFIRILIAIFYPKCTYLRQDMRGKMERRASEKPTFSFRQVPKAAKSFRGSIKRYDCSKLQRKRLLGKGGLCEAWLCNYQGNDVVAKVPLDKATPDEREKMFRAARQQMKFDHENILRVLGVFEDERPPTILLELAEGGDMSDMLIGQVDLPTQWRLAKELAEAVFCLQTQVPFPYAHRDLKGMNVFLTKDYHVKLADFDFLVEIPEGVLVSGMCGTPGYIAPEMLDQSSPGYDHRCDIWSMGSVFYEITHSTNPFSKEVQGSRGPMSLDRWVPIVMELTAKAHRPVLDKRCPQKMRNLITDCWKQNPAERPDAVEIILRLDEMEADFDQ